MREVLMLSLLCLGVLNSCSGGSQRSVATMDKPLDIIQVTAPISELNTVQSAPQSSPSPLPIPNLEFITTRNFPALTLDSEVKTASFSLRRISNSQNRVRATQKGGSYVVQ